MNTVNNLRKLADYIEQHVPQEKLNMRYFRSDKTGGTEFKTPQDCGTSGCALGWAPFVEGLAPLEEEFDYDHDLAFQDYGRRVFPDLYEVDPWGPYPGILDTTADWNDVFHGRLSSDKAQVIERLRNMANKLEKQR